MHFVGMLAFTLPIALGYTAAMTLLSWLAGVAVSALALGIATQRDLHGITYVNTGDWVESCTAAVEHDDGRIEIIHWGSRARGEISERREADHRAAA